MTSHHPSTHCRVRFRWSRSRSSSNSCDIQKSVLFTRPKASCKSSIPSIGGQFEDTDRSGERNVAIRRSLPPLHLIDQQKIGVQFSGKADRGDLAAVKAGNPFNGHRRTFDKPSRPGSDEVTNRLRPLELTQFPGDLGEERPLLERSRAECQSARSGSGRSVGNCPQRRASAGFPHHAIERLSVGVQIRHGQRPLKGAVPLEKGVGLKAIEAQHAGKIDMAQSPLSGKAPGSKPP